MSNRERLIELSKKHKLSHLGSCISALPIIEEIYAKRRVGDKFVLSAGHSHLAHLVVMESGGEIDAEEKLKEYGIHCDRRAGCDASTGSLGLGITLAVGMALAEPNHDVYCLVSDGEMAEGAVWEALEIAHKQKVKNLKLHFNFNGWGAYDAVDTERLEKRLMFYNLDIKVHHTSSDIGTWSIGLQSHYKVADEELK